MFITDTAASRKRTPLDPAAYAAPEPWEGTTPGGVQLISPQAQPQMPQAAPQAAPAVLQPAQAPQPVQPVQQQPTAAPAPAAAPVSIWDRPSPGEPVSSNPETLAYQRSGITPPAAAPAGPVSEAEAYRRSGIAQPSGPVSSAPTAVQVQQGIERDRMILARRAAAQPQQQATGGGKPPLSVLAPDLEPDVATAAEGDPIIKGLESRRKELQKKIDQGGRNVPRLQQEQQKLTGLAEKRTMLIRQQVNNKKYEKQQKQAIADRKLVEASEKAEANKKIADDKERLKADNELAATQHTAASGFLAAGDFEQAAKVAQEALKSVPTASIGERAKLQSVVAGAVAGKKAAAKAEYDRAIDATDTRIDAIKSQITLAERKIAALPRTASDAAIQEATNAATRLHEELVGLYQDKTAMIEQGPADTSIQPAQPAQAPANDIVQVPQVGQPVQVKGDDDFARLPSGAEFIGPDGKKRRKP